MKFTALAAIVGAASAAGTCTWDMNIFLDGSPCTGSSETLTMSGPINQCTLSQNPLTGDTEYMQIMFCDPAEGVVVWYFTDAACAQGADYLSTDRGCPTGGCCHLSGTGLGMDFDGDGNPDLSMAFSYSTTVLAQSGSKYGLGFGDIISEFFAMLG